MDEFINNFRSIIEGIGKEFKADAETNPVVVTNIYDGQNPGRPNALRWGRGSLSSADKLSGNIYYNDGRDPEDVILFTEKNAPTAGLYNIFPLQVPQETPIRDSLEGLGKNQNSTVDQPLSTTTYSQAGKTTYNPTIYGIKVGDRLYKGREAAKFLTNLRKEGGGLDVPEFYNNAPGVQYYGDGEWPTRKKETKNRV